VRIVLGIGNPGRAYADTRHNVGWWVLESILDSARPGPTVDVSLPIGGSCRTGADRPEWVDTPGPYLESLISGEESAFLILKPLTYVNRSGAAAWHACLKHGAPPSDLLVVLDDIHLPVGQIRLRGRGSDGGHNGMASVSQDLGTTDVPRLRIGIGAPTESGALVSHVLSPFDEGERSVIAEAVAGASDVALSFGRGGYEEAAATLSRQKPRAVSQ
jgi:peptidyl-tRNA hydrolase, PTH1 family